MNRRQSLLRFFTAFLFFVAVNLGASAIAAEAEPGSRAGQGDTAPQPVPVEQPQERSETAFEVNAPEATFPPVRIDRTAPENRQRGPVLLEGGNKQRR